MRKDIFGFMAILFAALLISCSKSLEDNLLVSETGSVNGFTVTWMPTLPETKRQIVRDILNDMVLVEGGSFMMGTNPEYDPDARLNESPAHLVRLSDYYICAHELSFEQVRELSWDDRKVYGDYIVYDYNDWEELLSTISKYCDIEFSMPTEAQWEFAARGGVKSKGFIYPGSNTASEIWCDLKKDFVSLPNELGIYNMADGYGEWCKDYYADYINGTIQYNPCVNVSEKNNRVVRGGCHASFQLFDKWHSSTSQSDLDYGLASSTSYSSGYSSCRDKRHRRSTARSYNAESLSYTIRCRPVINIK